MPVEETPEPTSEDSVSPVSPKAETAEPESRAERLGRLRAAGEDDHRRFSIDLTPKVFSSL